MWRCIESFLLAGKWGLDFSTQKTQLIQSVIWENGSASRTRTYDRAINSRLLYQLSYRGTAKRFSSKPGFSVKP